MGKCIICGKTTPGTYIFCKDCNALKDAGKVIKCEKCGKWHYSDKPCVCEKPINKTVEQTKDGAELNCIICGKPSNGKHFCIECYKKYKDRAVDLRITNCTKAEILDEYGNLQYKCDDGRKVRSRAEAMISSWFFNQKIRVIYEETIYYTDEKTGETKTLHPDFFLPDYDIYIEYNELTDKEYIKSKQYTKSIYEKLNKNIIIMAGEDLKDISACLKPKLKLN